MAPRRVAAWVVLTVAVGMLAASGWVSADVLLAFHNAGTVGTVDPPFEFVNGANYATVNAAGWETNTYPLATDTSITVTFDGMDGAEGTYLLDTVTVETEAATVSAWTLGIDVSTALVATGVNAAWVSYCTVAPTAAGDSGTALATGTDANGNLWTLYAPTCTGTEVNTALTAVATGTTVNVATGTAAGTTVLYISFLVAVTNTGATTTTAAGLSLADMA